MRLRHEEVHRWFGGRPVYTELKTAVYAPASYLILWPLLGWLEPTPAAWLWAATTVVALGWLIHLTVQASGADTRLDRLFVAMIPLSMYATGGTIGNGQLIAHLLPVLVAGLLLLQRGQSGWRTDLIAAAMILVALVKPNVSVPFLWSVLFVPGRLRPALLVAFGYTGATLFAVSFQEPGLLPVLRGWLAGSLARAGGGYADLHVWLVRLGMEKWVPTATILALGALGFWTYRHRHGDIWILLGVTALVARFWAYHRWYDDLLILLPMVALFRVAKRGPSSMGSDVVAGLLLAITILAMVAPGGLYLLPPPWNSLYVAWQTVVLAVVLMFLLMRARHEDTARSGS